MLTLLAAPVASAGSEESPELVDRGGDVRSGSLSSAGSDLLAAWLHEESPEGFRLTLKLAELRASHVVGLGLYWSLEGPEVRPRIAFGGVRADVGPAGVSYALLEGDYPGDEFRAFRPVASLEGSTEFGEPAYVTWDVTARALPLPAGTTFVGWGALTFLEGPAGFVDYRDAATSARLYQVGLARVSGGFGLPERPLDRTDAAGDVGLAHVDLAGAWVEPAGRELRIIFAVAQVGGVATGGCHARLLFTAARKDAAPLVGGALLRVGSNRTEGLERVQIVPTAAAGLEPRDVAVRLGRPGHVRFTFADAGDGPLPPPQGIRATMESQSPCRAGREADRLDDPQGAPALPPWVVAAAAAWVVRRKL